jgi:predicted GNAT family N-acyltransferase
MVRGGWKRLRGAAAGARADEPQMTAAVPALSVFFLDRTWKPVMRTVRVITLSTCPVPALEFRSIQPASEAYRLECGLRNEVLRRPLGLDLRDDDLSAEADQSHFGLFDGGSLVACVIVMALTPSEVKLRQMAVSPAAQGKGVGRQLLDRLHIELLRQGCEKIVLHARMSAVGFYSKLGYHVDGEEFTEVGIPHRKMWKRLADHRTALALCPR